MSLVRHHFSHVLWELTLNSGCENHKYDSSVSGDLDVMSVN